MSLPAPPLPPKMACHPAPRMGSSPGAAVIWGHVSRPSQREIPRSLPAKSGTSSFEILPADLLLMRGGNCIRLVRERGSSYLHAVSVVMQRGGVCGCLALPTARPRPPALQCQESLAFTTAGVTCPGKHAVMILLMSAGSWGKEGGIEEGSLLASSLLGFGGVNTSLAT